MNPLVEALLVKDWDNADYHAQKGRIFTQRLVEVPNFYNGVNAEVFPLHVACQYGAPSKTIELLHSIFPMALTMVDSKYKRSPLHLAVMQGLSPKTVKFLVGEHGKAAALPDALGRLPLHYSCKDTNNGEANTRLLLKAYAKGAIKGDSNGFLPLHVACRMGMSLETLKMLTSVAPQTVHAKTKKGSTAMSCAKAFGKDPFVIDLLERTATKEGVGVVELEEHETAGSVGSFKSNPSLDSKTMAGLASTDIDSMQVYELEGSFKSLSTSDQSDEKK